VFRRRNVTIQNDRGNVTIKTLNGTIDVTIQARLYPGDVEVVINRNAGRIQVKINGSASEAQVTVVVGTEKFTKTIKSGPVFVRLTEKRLVISEQAFKVRPSGKERVAVTNTGTAIASGPGSVANSGVMITGDNSDL
jgi:hypothetical protein